MSYTTRYNLSKTAPVSLPFPASARFAALDRFAGETYVARFFDADEATFARSFADAANLELVEIVDFVLASSISSRTEPTITYKVESATAGTWTIVHNIETDEAVAAPADGGSYAGDDEIAELLAEAFDAGSAALASLAW